jgi:hypothetical protein
MERKMTEMIFATRLWNGKKRDPVPVFDQNGVCLVSLEPGQSATLQTKNPTTLYARWTEIGFSEGGEVEFTERKGFVEPDLGRWVITMLNVHGRPCEVRFIGGRIEQVPDDSFGRVRVVADFHGNPLPPVLTEKRVGGRAVHLPRGIPVRVGVPANDELAPYERFEIRIVEKLRPRPMVTGYLEQVRKLEDVLIPRSVEEIQALQEELDRLMTQQEGAQA